jgi:imidazolonepropionase-like amidohydrolase
MHRPHAPRPRSALAAALVAIVAACGGGDAPDSAATGIADLAIENVTVVDAANGVREARTVVVRDGRIASVQDAGAAIDAREVVDGTGQWLIPGLWDFHVHLTYDDRFDGAMAGLFLHHGVTSIRDTGGALDQVVAAVGELEAEGATAPRVFFAGPLMDGELVVYDGESRPELGIANPDADAVRANMARLEAAGVDFVKIYEMVSPEIFEVLVEEAEARGLPMDGHVPLSMRARDVGPRVQSLEHLRNIEMDCVVDAEARVAERRAQLADPGDADGGTMRSRLHRAYRIPSIEAYDEAECDVVLAAMANTIQVPTLRLNALSLRPPFERPDWAEVMGKVPESVAEDWGRRTAGDPRDTTFEDWSLFLVGRMHEAGVPIGAGTDTPISSAVPGYSLHSELEMLVRAGLPPIEALRAATLRPAEFFGLADEMGTIEPGRVADLVLLSADPLEDIANTRSVAAVVTRGTLLDRAELDALVR